MQRYRLYKSARVGLSVLLCLWLAGCAQESEPTGAVPPQQEADRQESAALPADPNWPHPRSDERLDERRAMVRHLREAYEMDDAAVLAAVANVPRHWFVPEQSQHLAYADGPLPIGHEQTISQPFIVALMTGFLDLDEESKVLEIGTGSGYQAAVLTEFTPHVYSIEILEPLGKQAQKRLQELGYRNVEVRIGDGYKGWPEHQPFDAIIVTCAPDHIPPALLEQLAPGGKMVIPVGPEFRVQELVVVTKNAQGQVASKSIIPVRFVPMLRDKAD